MGRFRNYDQIFICEEIYIYIYLNVGYFVSYGTYVYEIMINLFVNTNNKSNLFNKKYRL